MSPLGAGVIAGIYPPIISSSHRKDITASQTLEKATGRLLLWVGFVPSLFGVCGPINQLFSHWEMLLCHQEVKLVKGLLQWQRCLTTRVIKTISPPCPDHSSGCLRLITDQRCPLSHLLTPEQGKTHPARCFTPATCVSCFFQENRSPGSWQEGINMW